MVGSTIANKLVRYGAEVTIVDICEPGGSNFFNTQDIKDKIQISRTDIRDRESIKPLLKNKDIVFNLAAQVSHNDSITNPFLDAEINYLGHLNILENMKRLNPEATILYSGSRLQFGRIQQQPVAEDHPKNPLTPYSLNKTAAENMYLFYYNIYNIPCVIFRIANPYGPRSQMKHHKYSMVNWFLRLAMENKTIEIFGNGEQIRDYIYVEDLADAFINASVEPRCRGEVFNIGSGVGTRFRDMAETIVKTVGSGKIEFVPWPDDYVNVETGDYITDITKICNTMNWSPSTNLASGIKKTFEYYKKFKNYYW